MTVTMERPARVSERQRPTPLSAVQVEAELRARDLDPEYRDAPVLDIYGRISRNPETGEPEQVDRQVLDCLLNIRTRRARLGMILRDDGVSAWSLKAKRPGWQTLVKRLESRTSDGVICWHTDRLMRQSRDLERLNDFAGSGLLVGSCHGDYDLSDSDARFTLRVLTAAAAKDSDNTSRRQRRKAAAMREQGRRGGVRAFGEPGWEYGTRGKDTERRVSAEQVQAERDAIGWAVRAHLAGTSVRTICREWTQRGLTSARGTEWDPRTVVQVLTNPRIAGLLTHRGTVVGRLCDDDGEPVEPIVTEAEFSDLQTVFASRRRGRPVSEPYLLSGGLLICGGCGRPMTGRAKVTRGQSVRRYACRDRNGGCGKVGIVADATEQAVTAMVLRTLADPKHASRMVQASADLAAVQAKIANAEWLAEQLSDRLGRGEITLTRYDKATAPLDERISALKAEAAALQGLGAAGPVQRRASTAQVRQQWEAATVEQRRAMIREAAPLGIEVAPGTAANQHSDVTRRLNVRTPHR